MMGVLYLRKGAMEEGVNGAAVGGCAGCDSLVLGACAGRDALDEGVRAGLAARHVVLALHGSEMGVRVWVFCRTASRFCRIRA